ncbi:salicylate hydroxylase [Devosia pacifica]|uniref:Salicylate hydroxylase n=1 Tax=Devosia pacifica TaxID=1335967 RepID=A0A918VP80_9HYPH|nr:FAD-dependent oxidoreductase [Devosia pacifica]GHA14075.1 salicylate hydroxylase [Devosia pacifica]
MGRNDRTVYIAGAGIAGLTIALALAKRGLQVVVLERADQVAEFGAGLQLSPNAYRVLEGLGLGPAILERAFEPAGIDVYTASHSEPLVTLTLGQPARERFGSPYVVMHRGDLAEALYRACKRFANIECIFGVSDLAVSRDGNGVLVEAEKLQRTGRSGRGFAFIGADGVRSNTRTTVLKGPPAQFTHKLAWRTLVSPERVQPFLSLENTSLLLAPDTHLVAYPLPRRNAVNLVLFLNADAPEAPQQPKLPRRASRRLMGLVDAADQPWTAWPLFSVHTRQWHDGPVGLLGDAAHAMLPFQAQGAALAIEDAACLAPLLADGADAEQALAAYARSRQMRVKRVATLSRRNGQIFHMRPPLSVARDTVMRLQGKQEHFRRLGWLYDHDAGAPATVKR